MSMMLEDYWTNGEEECWAAMRQGNKCKISHMGMEMFLSLGTLPVHITVTAHACVVAREVIGELDGEFEDDAEGAVESAGGE